MAGLCSCLYRCRVFPRINAIHFRGPLLNCPFCDEEIKDRALVCKHCGRDLSVLRPVVDRLAEIETRLGAMESALQTLSGHVDTVRAANSTPNFDAVAGAAVLRVTLPRLVLLVLLLLIAHWTIVGVLDLDTKILRLVSIVIPLPFGMHGPKSLRASLWAGFAAAGAAVIGMLVTTSVIDHVPVWPQGLRDWLETLEYVASIGLSYVTGWLIAAWWRARRTPGRSEQSLVYDIASLLARSSAPRNETRLHAKQRVEAIANWLNILALLLTATCSIATGVGRFFH